MAYYHTTDNQWCHLDHVIKEDIYVVNIKNNIDYSRLDNYHLNATAQACTD